MQDNTTNVSSSKHMDSTAPPTSATPLLSSSFAGSSYSTLSQNTQERVIEKSKVTAIWTTNSYRLSIASLVLLVVTFSTLEYYLLVSNLPEIEDPIDREALKFPRSLVELRALNEVLSLYIEEHYANVMIAFVSVYIYLQSFSIPGSMWLSVLGGALFNFWIALFVVCACSAIGATVAYFISFSLGSVVVQRNFGERIDKWHEKLSHYRSDFLYYVIFLRISPLPPNWFANIACPHLGVPVWAFFFGTFIGVMAPSFIHISAGAALDRLGEDEQLRFLTPMNVAALSGCAVAALVPILIRRRWGRQMNVNEI